jgi:hypothetical protein
LLSQLYDPPVKLRNWFVYFGDHSKQRRKIEQLLRLGQQYEAAAYDRTGTDVADWLQEAGGVINVYELSDSCDSSDSSDEDSNRGASAEPTVKFSTLRLCHLYDAI